MDEQSYAPDYSADLNYRIRDIEENQRLMKERVMLLGKTVIGERDKNFLQVQEMKKNILKLKADISRMKEIIQNIAEQMNNFARKEDLMIIQRQIDLMRKDGRTG